MLQKKMDKEILNRVFVPKDMQISTERGGCHSIRIV